MLFQKIDGIEFKMGEKFDFSFLKKYGKVFKVFDDQDSGNICFGIESQGGRIFVKFAGAKTAEYNGDISEAIKRLKTTGEHDKKRWPLSSASYNVLMKAISPDRNNRYISIAEFSKCWNSAIS